MGWGMGRGYPPRQLTRGLGERRELPQCGPGRSPAENDFGVVAILVADFVFFSQGLRLEAEPSPT